MRVCILRQQPRQRGQVFAQLRRQHIGRIDNEHAAAVHTKAVSLRAADVEFGTQRFGRKRRQFFRQHPAFGAAQTGIPHQIAAGGKALKRGFQRIDRPPVVLLFFVRRIDQYHGTARRGGGGSSDNSPP